MVEEMEPGRCHVCLVEDQKVTEFPYMPELVLKHLGVLVYDKVLACEACNKLLNLWDEFLDESRLNMQVSHPTALHQYKQKVLGLGASRSTGEGCTVKSDPEVATVLSIPVLKTEDHISEPVPIKVEVSNQQEQQQVFDCSSLFNDIENKSEPPQLSVQIPEAVEDLEPMDIDVVSCSPTIKAGMNESERQQENPQVTPDGSVSPPYISSSDDELMQNSPNPKVTEQNIPISPHTLTENINTPKFTCQECKRGFSHEVFLNNHIKMKSCNLPACKKVKQKNYLVCPKCNVRFPLVQSLLPHILENHCEQKDSKFICVYCDTLSLNRNSLKSHLRTHFGNAFHYKCKFCKKVLSTKQKLKNHIRSEHEDADYKPKTTIWKDVDVFPRSRFPCIICNKILSTKNSLSSHMDKLHPSFLKSKGNNKKKHICEVCGNSFGKKQGLSSHMKHHSQDQVPEYNDQNSNQSNNIPPTLKLTIFKDSGSFSCKIGETETFDTFIPALTNQPIKYAVDSIEIPVPDIDLNIHENSSNNSDSDSQIPKVQTFTCIFCNKTMFSKVAIEYHITRSHIKENHHLMPGAHVDSNHKCLSGASTDKDSNNVTIGDHVATNVLTSVSVKDSNPSTVSNCSVGKSTIENTNIDIEIIELD